jgi:adenine phosphoribosyltransferase
LFSQDVDAIAGLDARGFVLGPPIALALQKPFIMVRKMGKLPNAVTGKEYFKEYSAATGDFSAYAQSIISHT